MGLARKKVGFTVGNGISGRGLFSNSAIAENALIIEFKGERISRAEMEAHEKVYYGRGVGG